MANSILTINCGSSSLKACLFGADGGRRDFFYPLAAGNQTAAFDTLLADMGNQAPDAVGHRFVHGGDISDSARLLDDDELCRLEGIAHLAPLHMPVDIRSARLCLERFAVPQVACFDTAFHHSLPELARRLPIPRELGLRRYGFHGLNYAHVARTLPQLLGDEAQGRVIVAHLGSGASLCLLHRLRSVDTTMGYTPAGGLTMATRSGDLDPGVMLELAKQYPPQELEQLVYRQMGLLALSGGESADMAQLLASPSDGAHFAIEYFCRQVQGFIGAMAAKAGGCDALVFTGGIGENAALVREKVCQPLAFMGIELEPAANRGNQEKIHQPGTVPVLIIAADEAAEIRHLTAACIAAAPECRMAHE